MTAAAAAETRDSDSKARSVVDSTVEAVHKVALAGAGVAGEAVDAGSKVFDRLVARGEKVESRGRESISGWRDKAEVKVQQVRSAAEKGIEQTKTKARTGIDEHLERRLEKLGVPGKADLDAVIERLSAIEARLATLEEMEQRSGDLESLRTAVQEGIDSGPSEKTVPSVMEEVEARRT